MTDTHPKQSIQELLRAVFKHDDLYEKDGYGGYQVNVEFAESAILALFLDAVTEAKPIKNMTIYGGVRRPGYEQALIKDTAYQVGYNTALDEYETALRNVIKGESDA